MMIISPTQSRCQRCLKLYTHKPNDPIGSVGVKTPCCQAAYWPIHQLGKIANAKEA